MSVTVYPLREAATCVIVRSWGQQAGSRVPAGVEVLLLLRNPALPMDGDIWVFPGGKIEDEDRQGVVATDPVRAELDVARIAAARETREETSLILEPPRLVPLSHWTTPPTYPRRFATWFFVTDYCDGDVQVDGSEIVDYAWLPPQQALERHHTAQARLYPPTLATLAGLQEAATVADVIARATAGPVVRNLPQLDADNNFFLHSEIITLP